MARLRGRAPRGERLRSAIPHGHWKTTTFVAGLRLSGLVAPMVLDGPINREAFQAYIDQVLVPELSPGDVVVMDNLAAHKAPRVRALLDRSGFGHRYLPAYSPDLNPIEPAWAKVEAALRRVAARTADTLHEALGPALGAITPHDAAGFFRHCGYSRPG